MSSKVSFRNYSRVFDHHQLGDIPAALVATKNYGARSVRNTRTLLPYDWVMMAVMSSFTAFVSRYKKRPRYRSARGRPLKCPQWRMLSIGHFTPEAQVENLPCHTHVGKDYTVQKRKRRASRITAHGHGFIVDIAAEYVNLYYSP